MYSQAHSFAPFVRSHLPNSGSTARVSLNRSWLNPPNIKALFLAKPRVAPSLALGTPPTDAFSLKITSTIFPVLSSYQWVLKQFTSASSSDSSLVSSLSSLPPALASILYFFFFWVYDAAQVGSTKLIRSSHSPVKTGLFVSTLRVWATHFPFTPGIITY